MKKQFLFSLTLCFLFSCKKDKTDELQQVLTKQIIGTKGVYVLCEGDMGKENSTISYYDLEKKTVVVDYYGQVNGKPLGETANDLKTYGSKLYCVVTGIQGAAKSFVDVMDAATGKTIKRIAFNSTNEGYMPRFITFYKDKAYVSRYDGKISRIDTASLNIDAELQLKNGTNNAGGLEGLAVANGKLYVTNSVHSLHPGAGNKVTVVDLNTFTQKKDITVVVNPLRIAAAENGELLVVSWGNFSDISPSLQRINSTMDEVTGSYNQNVVAISIYKNQAYLTTNWGSSLFSFDIAAGALGTNLITDATKISNSYGVTVNPFDQSFVVSSADYNGNDNRSYVFGKDGKLKFDFATGPLPQTAAFNYAYKYEYKNL